MTDADRSHTTAESPPAQRAAQKSRFLADSLFQFVANSVVNALNYAFLLTAIHILSKPAFGTLNTMLACLTISTVVINSLQMHVTRTVALDRTGAPAYVRAILRQLAKFSGVGGILALATIWPAGSLLDATWYEWLLTAVATAALLYMTLAVGIAGGFLLLRVQAVAYVVGTAVKLGVGMLLMYVGLGTSGALIGYVVGLTLTTILIAYALAEYMRPDAAIAAKHVSAADGTPRVRPEALRLPFVIAYLFMVAPFSLDQVLVQVLARPLSGDYGTVVTFGRIVFMAVGPLLWVQYSHLSDALGDAARLRRVFWSGFGFSVGMALVVAAALVMALGLFARVLLSEKYAYAAPQIGLMAWALVAHVAAQAVALLLLARGQTLPLMIVAGALPLQVFLFATRNNDLVTLAHNQVVVYVIQFVLVLIAAGISRRSRRRVRRTDANDAAPAAADRPG